MVTRDERISQFNRDGFPPPDLQVQVLCEDKSGTYVPPFACRYTDGIWLSVISGMPLEVEVLGWLPAKG